MNFPTSKIMEHMQKSKNKEGNNSFKTKSFQIQIIICAEREKKTNKTKKITVLNYPVDGEVEKGREDGDLHCLRDMQWLQS